MIRVWVTHVRTLGARECAQAGSPRTYAASPSHCSSSYPIITFALQARHLSYEAAASPALESQGQDRGDHRPSDTATRDWQESEPRIRIPPRRRSPHIAGPHSCHAGISGAPNAAVPGDQKALARPRTPSHLRSPCHLPATIASSLCNLPASIGAHVTGAPPSNRPCPSVEPITPRHLNVLSHSSLAAEDTRFKHHFALSQPYTSRAVR